MKVNPAHHPLLTLLVALSLAAISIFYTVRNLEFQTSQRDLVYPQDRLFQLSEQFRQFEELDSFVVVVETREPRRSLKFLQALVPRLEADKKNYLEIFSRVDPERFKPWALLYLDREDLLRLAENLQEHRRFIEELAKSPNLVNLFEQINQEMSSRMVGELFTGFLSQESSRQETLDLHFLIRVLSEMKKSLDGDGVFSSPWDSFLTKESWRNDSEEGYFWTKDKRYLLLLISPAKETGSFTETWHSLTALREAIAQVQVLFPDVKVGVTGPEALNADQMSAALEDMSLATILSLLSLAILLILFWKGFRRPLLEMTLLLVALSLTFGLTTLFIGHLNILSVTFAPLLLGLGIDYGVHLFARYQEEEQRPHSSIQENLQATLQKLGPGVLLAGLTAALSFFPLVLTGFKGLVELGIICSMGMVVMTLTTLGLLPALIILFDRRRLGSQCTSPSARIKPLFELTPRRVLTLLILAALGSAVSVWGGGKVRFDLNMLRLQSPKAESVIWEKKLIESSELSSMYGAVFARSMEEVRQKAKILESLPTVSKVESVDDMLPRDQGEKIAFLRDLRPILAGIGSLQRVVSSIDPQELEKTLGRIRFKMLGSSHSQWGIHKPLEDQMTQARELIDQLCQRFHSSERSRLLDALRTFQKALFQDLNDKFEVLHANINTKPMGLEDLPKSLLKRFVGKNHLYLIRAFPKEDVWEPKLLGQFVHDLRSVDPDAVGDPITLYVFTQAFRDGCIQAALYAVAFIMLLLSFTFREVTSMIMAMLPLGVGTAWTFGLMHLLGIDLNLANSPFLPLVVGAGVEYGIIILHRWRQREKGWVALPFSTGMGVILAGLTTTVGFGSLTISGHQGIYSLGLLAAVGSLSILAAAVLFLPALLHVFSAFSEKQRKTP